MKKTETVGSLSEYLSIVKEFHEEWGEAHAFNWAPWFRGEPNGVSPTRLQPKLYRNGSNLRRMLYEEQVMRVQFSRRAMRLIIERQPNGQFEHWEWYFLMQHHGVPTRLLDWSESSLAALYFAIRERGSRDDPNNGKDAAVFMLDAWWLNETAYEALGVRARGVARIERAEHLGYLSADPYQSRDLKPELPCAITPPHLSQRFAVQASQFTIFGTDTGEKLQTLASADDNRIRRIPIRESNIPAIQSELKISGIAESTLFPDLDGLGHELYLDWDKRHPK